MATRETLVTPEQVAVKAAAIAADAAHRVHPVADPNLPRSYALTADGSTRRDLMPRDLCTVLAEKAGSVWVDVDVTNRHHVAVLEKVFGFHPLTIEDTLNPGSRVKLEEYPDYLFLIVRGVRFCEGTDDPYDIETYNLCFYLGRNFVVTAHGGAVPSVASLESRLDQSPELLGRGVERVMHTLIDAMVDAYFPLLDQLDEFVDGLEARVFEKFDESALREIFSVKRLVLSLRRHLAPLREVLNVLTNRPSALLTAETQLYFRDIYDHVLRINESLETYRDLLGSTLDSYLSQVSNRMGAVTKGLSVVATLSIPFVVVSGMWGMNFTDIPMADNPAGFWIMLFLQIAIGIGLLALLRWQKLI